MAEPISGLETLQTSPEMMHRMELLCMRLQTQLCRQIERIEGTTKFKVDRWTKDQVGSEFNVNKSLSLYSLAVREGRFNGLVIVYFSTLKVLEELS